jgi:hypothetical protein
MDTLLHYEASRCMGKAPSDPHAHTELVWLATLQIELSTGQLCYLSTFSCA